MMTNLSNSSETLAFAYDTTGTAVVLDGSKGFCITSAVTNSAPAAGTFTAVAATDLCTLSAHGFLTGLKVQVSNAGGGLPTGLSAATDYFVIKVSASTFKLASSLANAQAGTAIDLTTNGTGTQTVTPTALAGGSAKLQASVDGTTYVDVSSSSTNITATANLMWNVVDPMYRYVRVAYVLTAGQLAVSQSTFVKGE